MPIFINTHYFPNTPNPKLMQEAKERLEEAICMAIQASKETNDEVN